MKYWTLPEFEEACQRYVDGAVNGMKAEAASHAFYEHAEAMRETALMLGEIAWYMSNERKPGDWPWTRVVKWWRRWRSARRIGLHALASHLHGAAAKAYGDIAERDDVKPPQ